MLSMSCTFNRLWAACVVAGVCFSGTSVAQAQPADLYKQLDAAVLQYAYSKEQKDLDAVNKLLKGGAKPDALILWHAAYYRSPVLVDRLLEFPVDVNQPISDNGETILLSILGHMGDPEDMKDSMPIVRSLIKAGADTNVIAQGGTNTPLIAAVGIENPSSVEVTKLLLQAGADPRMLTPQGFSPLIGKGANNLELIKLLIAAGTDPYGVSKVGSTPLHYVCVRAYALNDQPDPQAAQRIALLHKAGTSVDAFAPQQQAWPVGTPLLESAIRSNPDCTNALLAAGADKDAPAFPPEYVAQDPSVKGQTVRQNILKSVKNVPDLYSESIIKLFQ
ncbi:ankyrin repeat domain-containing protein [Pseudomonas sp. RA_105y_Pfl2_P56]|uniref:ankyrin repeat domain-containing protein n=1 Tax=Pseudomonas sp. RA_105y_Pfl2_P56 TaxID=3088701 RepID=UPI0030DB094C